MSLANRHRWSMMGVALAVAIAVAAIIFQAPSSGLSLELANGNYSSDCCGTIELRDGQMTANGANWVRYTIERDDRGPYLLPGRFVGTQGGGIVLDGGRPVVKLRLDRLPSPTRMLVPGIWGPDSFVRNDRRARPK